MDMAEFFKGMKRLELFTPGNERQIKKVRSGLSNTCEFILSSSRCKSKKKLQSVNSNLLKPYIFCEEKVIETFPPCPLNVPVFLLINVCVCISVIHC